MAGGDFSAEAYQQLRDAYDKEQQRQVDDEIAGTQLMGQQYSLETVPVDSPWKDKIENWTYPSGKSQYLDEHQSPEEILEIMRSAAQERVDAKKQEEDPDGVDGMSDEEFDAYVDQLLEGVDLDSDEEEEDEDEDEEESEESEEEEEDENEEEESEEDEEDEEEPEEEEEDSDEPEEDDSSDAEDIAAEIAALRAEIEAIQFVTDTPEEDDEPNLQEDAD